MFEQDYVPTEDEAHQRLLAWRDWYEADRRSRNIPPEGLLPQLALALHSNLDGLHIQDDDRYDMIVQEWQILEALNRGEYRDYATH